MIPRLIITAFLLAGCASAPSGRSAAELQAENVARQYAIRSFGLSKAQVARMVTDCGVGLDDGRSITIQFYDPRVIRPTAEGFIWAMDGGFPSYFRITVDIREWRVTDHYASPE